MGGVVGGGSGRWVGGFLVITVSHPTFLLCCVVVAVEVGL